jgi:hypothetical protein
MGIIIGSAMLLIAGASVYIDNNLNSFSFIKRTVDIGNTTMLFLLFIVPIFFAIAPLAIDYSKKTKKKTSKK